MNVGSFTHHCLHTNAPHRTQQVESSSTHARELLRTSKRDSAHVMYLEGGPINVGDVERGALQNGIRLDVCLAGAKLIGGMQWLHQRKVAVEKGSVYGAAILMPQLGRSLGWPSYIVSLTISAYVYLAICVFINYALLIYLSKEELVMDQIESQMFLCDFGAYLDYAGDHTGPGGTQMTSGRLYNWKQWAARVYAHDAVAALLPGLAANATTTMDPGEYGGESWWARIVCCFIFLINICDELVLTANLLKLLFFIPSEDETWIDLDDAEVRSNKAGHWTKEVTVKVAGMPLMWKAVNMLLVFLPKLTLCWMTSKAGITFLMETSTIDEVIINSVALGFLLEVDEILIQQFMSEQARWLLEKCEDFVVDEQKNEMLTEGEQVERFILREKLSLCAVALDLLANRLHMLILSIVLTFVFVTFYYVDHCVNDNGRYVAKPLYLPTSTSYTFANFVLPSFFHVDRADDPSWQYSR